MAGLLHLLLGLSSTRLHLSTLPSHITTLLELVQPSPLQHKLSSTMARLVNPVGIAHSPPVLAALGLITHLILHRDEWDNSMASWLVAWFFGFSGLAAAEYLQGSGANSVGAVVKVAATAAAIYFSVLSTSILAHRVLFHRLRKVNLKVDSTIRD